MTQTDRGKNTSGSDYRGQLIAELTRRKIGNPSYSLRAFARALGLSAPFLSKILRGQKALSTDTAAEVAERLGYNEEEAKQFCRLVQLEKSSSPVARRALSQGLAGDEDDNEYHSLDLDTFQVISDWYHYAILELASCESGRLRPGVVAKRLGIKEWEASAAIERLERLGLLERKGERFTKSKAFIATPSGKPSRALRNFHSQMIEKARSSLEAVPVELRDISGTTIPVNPAKIDVVRREIQTFRRRIAKLLETDRPSEVYQLNVQFFPLSSPPRKP